MVEHSREIEMLKGLLAVLIGLLSCGAALADPVPAKKPIAIETLFDHSQYGAAVLSPNTKLLAATAKVGKRMRLIVIDIDTQKAKVVAGFDDSDIGWFRWINDDRLVFSVADLSAALGEQPGSGLYAVDADGARFRELIPTMSKQISSGVLGGLRGGSFMVRCRGTDDILVIESEVDKQGIYIKRVNTRSGRSTSEVTGISGDIIDGMADAAGVLRAITSVDREGHPIVWYRASAEAKWEQVARFPSMTSPDIWKPVGFSPDGKTMWVSGHVDRDLAGIYAYDLEARKLGGLVISHPSADIDRSLRFDPDTGELLGVYVDADRYQANWLDTDWARAQATVDKVLPGYANLLSGRAKSRVLVYSYSDRDPGRYYLYDVQKGSLAEQLAIFPAISPTDMAAMSMIHYEARDKLSIPAYLTLPTTPGGAKPPLVVLVHGGPWARDEWGFNREVQFLASRGYAVLQPQFRASIGFGEKLYRAGWKTWGLSMQDDITDGVKAMVDRGLVDPKRVCIMGASYGGYATLMGVAKDPDLYRCGVEVAGVSDIRLMFDITWSDMVGGIYEKYMMKELLGDPDKLKDQFIATSPIAQAGKIKAPLLLAYGSDDYRVPIKHGEDMRDALKAAGKSYEWHVYAGEGHGLMKVENRYNLYRAIEDFLDRNLKTPN
jgi:dipeptidyl aminopeptidase/acylaminoacyl peptidase